MDEKEDEGKRSGQFWDFVGTSLWLWFDRMVGPLSVTRHQGLQQIIKLVNKSCQRDVSALWRVSPFTIRNGINCIMSRRSNPDHNQQAY